MAAFGGTVIFSPDSKHIAAGTRKPQGYGTVYVDGTFLPERLALGIPKAFTPDSQHLLTAGPGDATSRPGVGLRYFSRWRARRRVFQAGHPWENSPRMKRDETTTMSCRSVSTVVSGSG